MIVTLEINIYMDSKMIFRTQKGIFYHFFFSFACPHSFSDTHTHTHTHAHAYAHAHTHAHTHTLACMINPKWRILLFRVDLQNLQRCISQVSRTSREMLPKYFLSGEFLSLCPLKTWEMLSTRVLYSMSPYVVSELVHFA